VSFAFQNVTPKGNPGVAQPDGPPPQQGGGGGGSSGSAFSLLFPLLIMVPFLFLMFRRQKKEQEARGKLKKGDTVVSQSGLVGELMELDERFAKVKIAPGTTVKMLVSSIGPLDAQADKKAEPDKDLKDLKEAKASAEKK
jgi:preprotein translocase subunit YajC